LTRGFHKLMAAMTKHARAITRKIKIKVSMC
jgi:hypothetical protein